MKKFKLILRVRRGLGERDFEEYGIDTESFTTMFRMKDLTVFDDESYLVGSLIEITDELSED